MRAWGSGSAGVGSTALLALDVALTPAFVTADAARRARTVYIVVDVVRATTTLSVMFGQPGHGHDGCARVLVAPGIAEARAAAQSSPQRYLLGGESGGVAPPGFDFGNSPREYAAADLAGRELIFATTNGTKALRACAGGFAIFAGSFRNAGAVARAAVEAAARAAAGTGPGQEPHRPSTGADARPHAASEASEASIARDAEGAGSGRIVIVCAGRESRPAYDDTLCAGYLLTVVRDLAAASDQATTLGEGARIAQAVWGDLEQGAGTDSQTRTNELRAALAASDAGRAATSVGLESDLDWCAAIDASPAVPYVASTTFGGNLLEVLPLGTVPEDVED